MQLSFSINSERCPFAMHLSVILSLHLLGKDLFLCSTQREKVSSSKLKTSLHERNLMDIKSLLCEESANYPSKRLVIHYYQAQKSVLKYGAPYFAGLSVLANAMLDKNLNDATNDSMESSSVSSATSMSSALGSINLADTPSTSSISNTSFDGLALDSDFEDSNVKPKRKRANTDQLTALKETFKQSPFPSSECRKRLAKQLGMTPRSVQIWFQNQRQLARNLMPLKP